MNLLQFIRQLSPNCREATQLHSESMEHRLTFTRRVGLRIHLFLCKWCRRYARQTRFLSSAAKHCDSHEPATPLSPEARERINQAVRSAKD